MSGKRIVEVQTTCEHGAMYGHLACDHNAHGFKGSHDYYQPSQPDCRCPGGSKRRLTEGQYVLIEKVDDRWPESALAAADPFEVFVAEDGYNGIRGKQSSDILDALSDHTEGTP